jgi:hypothetical protein
VAFNILIENTTKYLMSTLDKLYEKPSMLNKVFLMKCLFDLKMIEGRSITDHFNEFSMIINRLNSLNVNFDEEFRALFIFCFLPEIWNILVMVVSNSIFGSNTLKFDYVGMILSEEIHRKSSNSTSKSGSVLNAKSKGISKERGNHSRGHGKS